MCGDDLPLAASISQRSVVLTSNTFNEQNRSLAAHDALTQ